MSNRQEEEFYKQKYLKYKAKYLELKGGNGCMTKLELEVIKEWLYYEVSMCSQGLCPKHTAYHKIVSFEHNIEEGKLLSE